MRWAQCVLPNCPPSQGQRPWPTINTPPWHPSRNTSPRNAICSPTHSIPTQHPFMPNCPPACLAHPPESFHLDDNIFVNHCQCFATRKSHCITTHHNISCFVNVARTCFAHVCLLALPRPCAFSLCDLLACTVHLISAFVCKQTSASLQDVCSWAWM